MRTILAVMSLLPYLAQAQVPSKLPYQGRLLKTDSTPETGVVPMTFGLYSASSGGSPLWSETQSLGLSDGYYAALLGDATALPLGVFTGSALYLGISIGGTELLPRQLISSVPYALRCDAARNVVGGTVQATSLQVGGKDLLDATGAMAAPLPVAATRPTSPSGGTVFYNSSAHSLEVYDGTTWQTFGGSWSSCREILEAGASTGDGTYTIYPSPGGAGVSVRCDMTTLGGGWTLMVRLNTNDATTQRWNSPFWASTAEIGTLTADTDYLSAAYSRLRTWRSVLLDYRYASAQSKHMAAAFYSPPDNLMTMKDVLTQTPSNGNMAWPRFWTNNSTADDWYGPNLRFQVVGDGGDNFRLWYNQVAVGACNQAGGLGCDGDSGSWYAEATFPSATTGCQENSIRGMLGTNGGGSLMTEALLLPSDAYEAGIMYVYVR